jgi:hypothetical protein
MLKEIGNVHLQQVKKSPQKHSPSKNYINTSPSKRG